MAAEENRGASPEDGNRHKPTTNVGSDSQRRKDGERQGIFGPDSILRMVSGESIGLLAGGRSLLLQIAHPMIAAGVADHSSYQRDPLGRLERTMDITMGIVFGDQRQSREAMRRFHGLHVPIEGRLPHEAGRFSAGTSYRAHDPALKLWVHATLIESSLLVYERFVAPMSPRERRRYYDESRLLARQFGIPASMIPATLEDFDAYYREMLEGDALAVTNQTRRLARDVLHPEAWIVLRAGGVVARFVSVGLLPERLRGEYGLTWGPRRQVALDAMARTSRTLLPLAPRSLRLLPQAGGSNLVQWIIGRGRKGPH